jgi:hypothetical protein
VRIFITSALLEPSHSDRNKGVLDEQWQSCYKANRNPHRMFKHETKLIPATAFAKVLLVNGTAKVLTIPFTKYGFHSRRAYAIHECVDSWVGQNKGYIELPSQQRMLYSEQCQCFKNSSQVEAIKGGLLTLHSVLIITLSVLQVKNF